MKAVRPLGRGNRPLPLQGQVRIVVADPTTVDAKRCLDSYYAELDDRFESGFDRGATRQVAASELRPPSGLLLLAYLGKEAVACGALKFHDGRVGEVKRLWVAPEARGVGLGRRLLATLESSAKKSGVKVIHLDTNRALTEAISLYKSSGYVEVEPFNEERYAHHWFEKRI